MSRKHKSVYGGCVILSSVGMHEMADRISALLKKRGAKFERCEVEYKTFANGEIKPKIPHTVRGEHVFFIHPMQDPDPNTALMKLLLTNDALKRASVSGITLVLPYMPYSRQDRKDEPRVPISARLIADLIESNSKVERIITLDMHADQEQGFFSIPVDNMTAMKVHAKYLRKKFGDDFSNVTVVSPDVGRSKHAQRLAVLLGKVGKEIPVAIIDKRREDGGKTDVFAIVGDIKGRDCILPDDMVDGGGTALSAMASVKKQGAKSVCMCITHPILSGDAQQKFSQAGYEIITTPTIPRNDQYLTENKSWLTVVSIDALLAKGIFEASIVGGSVSKLNQ